jgi:DNA-directed RNA polymerase II subunit RPB11
MNAPARHESYVLEDGEKAYVTLTRSLLEIPVLNRVFVHSFHLSWPNISVEVMEDTKIPNAATIKIVKQDHTLGNMLRA